MKGKWYECAWTWRKPCFDGCLHICTYGDEASSNSWNEKSTPMQSNIFFTCKRHTQSLSSSFSSTPPPAPPPPPTLPPPHPSQKIVYTLLQAACLYMKAKWSQIYLQLSVTLSVFSAFFQGPPEQAFLTINLQHEEQILKRSIFPILRGCLCSHLPYIINHFKCLRYFMQF